MHMRISISVSMLYQHKVGYICIQYDIVIVRKRIILVISTVVKPLKEQDLGISRVFAIAHVKLP